MDTDLLKFLSENASEVDELVQQYIETLPKFTCDNSIGKIARHLRLLGYDAVIEQEVDNNFSLYRVQKEHRIILTNRPKVQQLLDRQNKPPKKNPFEVYSDDEDEMDLNFIKYPYFFIKSEIFEEQLLEVTNYFKIKFQEEIFLTRCLKCNSFKSTVTMEKMSFEYKEKLKDFVGEKAFNEFSDHITFCTECKRAFWDGWYYPKCLKFAKMYSYHDKEEKIEGSDVIQDDDKFDPIDSLESKNDL